ncbi:hypothetical protein QZH41_001858 [Actinostola sp. cb2023]|nr:hypothetical protein QZH41_001858 [Actinostola sp. cb2023]
MTQTVTGSPSDFSVLNIDQSPVFASVSGSPIAATYTSTCDNPLPLREVPPVLSVIDQPSAFRFSSAPGTYTTTTQAYVSTPLSSSTPRTTVLPSNKDDCASAQSSAAIILEDGVVRNWRRPSPMSVEDRQALKTIDSTITKRDDHYQMGLLWKDDNPPLLYNRAVAEARLQHLKKRFRRDPDLEKKYRAAMTDYLAKGYARRLTDEEASTRGDVTWYLPHHPVTNPNKPGKVRVVFDAAAKFGGTSLNDCLLQGPTLTNDLTGVLISFRQHEIAFTADIEAMFYQVEVTPSDTDALRFLW